MKLSKGKILNYIYVLMLLCFSGNPFFTAQDNSKALFSLVTGVLMLVHYKEIIHEKRTKSLYAFIAFFLLIFILQYFTLGFVSGPGIIGFILKLIFGYIIIWFVGTDFRYTYFNLIFGLSLISLAGFLYTDTMGGTIPAIFEEEDVSKSIILFTQRFNTTRNSGMFWEPGAFAAYIIFGFLLYLGELKRLIVENPFKTSVILIALITTFSTTGYILLFLLILVVFIYEIESKYFVLFLPVIIITGYIGYRVFNESEFMKEKIINQYKEAKEHEGEFRPDRFGALFFDIYYIKKHPLVGNGIHEKTRFAFHSELMGEKLGHGNGFSNFLASMGFLSLFFYSFFILKWKKEHSIIFLLFIFLLLQGEPLMNYPLFLTIPFLVLFYRPTIYFKD